MSPQSGTHAGTHLGLAGLTSHDHGTGYQLSTNALTGKLLQGPGKIQESRERNAREHQLLRRRLGAQEARAARAAAHPPIGSRISLALTHPPSLQHDSGTAPARCIHVLTTRERFRATQHTADAPPPALTPHARTPPASCARRAARLGAARVALLRPAFGRFQARSGINRY